MADMVLACDSVIVSNPPIPTFVIADPEPSIVTISTPDLAVIVSNPPELVVIDSPQPSVNLVLPIPGPRGRDGTGTGFMADQDVQEAPDGILDTFTSATAFIPSSLLVFLNGLQEHHIIRLSTTSFQFTTPPEPGDTIKLAFSPA